MTRPVSLKNILEAALFAYDESLSMAQLIELFDEEERPSVPEITEALDALQVDYAERGVELKKTATGYRFQAQQNSSPWLRKLWTERPAKYTRAFLETLALIAYRQPTTRSEIEEIRGVAVNPNIIRALIEREWIKVVGHRDVPGKPELLGTTKTFLDYFNLQNLSELPSLQAIENLEKLDQIGLEAEKQLEQLSETP
jgi:segregation and condensation protein B